MGLNKKIRNFFGNDKKVSSCPRSEVKSKIGKPQKKEISTAVDKVPESPGDELIPLSDAGVKPKTNKGSKWQKCKQCIRKTFDFSHRNGFTPVTLLAA